MDRPARVIVLYNNDYDAELADEPDASSVEGSARATAEGLRGAGYTPEVLGLNGHDVLEVIPRLVGHTDLVFNLCESMAGDPCNEPTFVGLLDLFRIPYTGGDLLTLASCLYKHRCKDILTGRGVPTPAFHVSRDGTFAGVALEALDYPWFVKLEHEDASIGITEQNVVRSPAELRRRATALHAEFTQPILAERYVEGREVNVTLIGNGDDVRVLPLHEIDFAAMPPDRPRIVSYAAKWDERHVDYAGTKPVPLRDASPALVARVEQVARDAWAALGLRDYGRVDLRIDDAGTPWVIDVNPNPDISPDAGVARAAQVAGLTYPELIDSIVRTAWRRIRG